MSNEKKRIIDIDAFSHFVQSINTKQANSCSQRQPYSIIFFLYNTHFHLKSGDNHAQGKLMPRKRMKNCKQVVGEYII